MARQENNRRGTNNWTSNLLYVLYLVFLGLSVLILIKIVYLQFFWKPDPKSLELFGMMKKEQKLIPNRGDILSYDGKILATSEALYQVKMDCTIQKDHFAQDENKGKAKEETWRSKARVLSEELAKIYGDKSAQEYYDMILSYRDGKRPGRKDVKIGGQIDYQTLQEVRSCTLFNEGRNYGGIKIDTIETRNYPYGSLARKAIGQVKNNSDVVNDLTGIEGKYNFELHGKDGVAHLRRTDSREDIQDNRRRSIPAVDGVDVRTTLNIEYQNIADKALRRILEANEEIAGGCCMIMEVKTGAIRAMVNLRRENSGAIGETYNYVMWQANNPGSVFKSATLMALLDDGKVKLDDMIPTFGGHWSYGGTELPFDDYITYAKYPSGKISVAEALAISSNHVFRYLAAQNYGKEPEKFIAKLYEYKLLEKYDFDIDGLAKPVVREPSKKGWQPVDLPLIAMGYSVNVTPLHILTFYNAIANKGKLMKPYMVQDFEKHGEVIQQFKPVVLNGAICKPSTAETMTKALLNITEFNEGDHHRGTGWWSFRGSPVRVAGKTGTSRIEFENYRNGKKVYTREDSEGRHVHQGSFVGFFPAEDPQYTVISVTYTKPTLHNVYGAVSARVVREISDNLFLLNPQWGETLPASGSVPQMEEETIAAADCLRGEVPDLGGMNLSDALYSIENHGYECSYSGSGHVKSQQPAPYARLAAGSTVRIELE